MNPDQFTKHIAQLQVRFKKTIQNDIPKIVGNKAVSLFSKNFQNEGFFGDKWEEVNRRKTKQVKYKTKTGLVRFKTVTIGKNTAGERKILTGTGDLGRSINYRQEPGMVIVYSDLVYSRVHNEGLKAGRGKGFIMPKRQFIGNNKELDEAIKDIISNKLDGILK